MKTSKGKVVGVALLIFIAVGLLPATRDELQWRWASSQDKAQDYARYLTSWPSGHHAAEAKSRYDERSWADAQSTRTLEGYRRYEQAHPDGSHMIEARTLIEQFIWQQSTNANTIQSLESYLQSYGAGRFAAEARTRMEDFTWRQATNANTTPILEGYLKSYSTGRFATEARTRIEDLTWQHATTANTVQSFQSYLTSYSSGRFSTEARTGIEDLSWQRATNVNSIMSLRGYAGTYPKGRFLAEAQTRQAALRADDTPFSSALQKGTETALEEFLSEFPGHTKESEAQQVLKDITEGRDIVDLLSDKKIEIQTQGSGIQSISVRIRRLVPYPLTVRIPVGSYFVSANQSSQNMVTTAESKVRLTRDDWQSVSPSVACANRPRDIPTSKDTFSVQRSPHQAELTKLMPILDRARVSYPTRQAAVWIVTDDATYSDLGILVSRPAYSAFGGTRTIKETETARAMKICDEAGLDIMRKRIWGDRQMILRGVSEGELKKWLEEKQ